MFSVPWWTHAFRGQQADATRACLETIAIHDSMSRPPGAADGAPRAAQRLSRIVVLGAAISSALALPATALGADTSIPAGQTKTPADLGGPTDATEVQNGGTLEINGNANVQQSLYTLSGSGVADVGAIHSSGGNNTLSGDVVLADSAFINASAGRLTMDGDISSTLPLDLDLQMGGDGDILHTGNFNLGAAGRSYSFGKVGSGTLTLTGTNNTYSGYLDVQGGTLQIADGGRLTVDPASVNDVTLISANLVVTGAGSTFNNNDYLVLGRDTTDPTSITVDHGGYLYAYGARVGEGVGYAVSTRITATVDGTDSVWELGSIGITVGAAAGGTAALTISNGGAVTSTESGSILVGFGGDGTARVTGTGSELSTNASLTVGELFAGTLLVEQGGLATAHEGHIGVGSNGTVTVTGAGSKLETGDFLGIGEAGSHPGHGELAIEDGALAAADNVWIGLDNGVMPGSSGVLTVLGTAGARGVLETASLMKGNDTASALFDGGVLRATANTADNGYGNPFIGSYKDTFTVAIGSGGMFIDTRGFNVTAAAVLGDNDPHAPGFLDKQGSGTLVLTGENTYSGGTTIAGGTLQLGDGGTTGSIGGDVRNDGILAFNRSDVVTFDGTIAGSGGVQQIGTGMTLLTADSSGLAGISQVRNGILSVDGRLGSAMEVRGGRLQGTGQVGDTTNFAGGTIAPGNSIGTLTVAGNYTGNGGTLEIETVLGDDHSATDRLVVTGNTSGSTHVRVINAGGAGAQTSEGIKIVDVAGASGGSFTLAGNYTFQGDPAVVAGAYAYRLYQGGVGTPADGDWYLRSALRDSAPSSPPLYQAGAAVYEAYAGILQGFNTLDTLQQRLGNRSWAGGAAEAALPADAGSVAGGTWGRVSGRHASIHPRGSTTGARHDADSGQVEVGADGQLYSGSAGALAGGLSLRYGSLSADVSSVFGDGAIRSTGYGLGGSMTWYGKSGFYLDAQASVTWYNSDLSSSTAGTRLVSGNDGFGHAFGVETGRRIGLDAHWSVTPQAQLSYSAIDYDDFTDGFGSSVSLIDAHVLRGRLGISADYEAGRTGQSGQAGRLHAYGIANLYHDFHPRSETRLSGVTLVNGQDALWGGLGFGGTYDWGDGKYALYGEVTADTSLHDFRDSHTLTGRVGLNIRF